MGLRTALYYMEGSLLAYSSYRCYLDLWCFLILSPLEKAAHVGLLAQNPTPLLAA